MFIQQLQLDPQYYMSVVITVVISICIHELAHGVAAIVLGDRTPIESGHMTLNPAVHMGGFAILMLVLAGISWGSMPVNPSRLRGRFGDALVALAGPVSNVVLAVLALAGMGLWDRYGDWSDPSVQAENVRRFLVVFGFVNFNLALFNLLPVPPLDGSRILSNLSVPYRDLMDRLAAGGGLQFAFIIVFLFASRITTPAATWATGQVLLMTRGY